jgi:hypothetical protein
MTPCPDLWIVFCLDVRNGWIPPSTSIRKEQWQELRPSWLLIQQNAPVAQILLPHNLGHPTWQQRPNSWLVALPDKYPVGFASESTWTVSASIRI